MVAQGRDAPRPGDPEVMAGVRADGDVRVAIGSVAATVVRASAAEQVLSRGMIDGAQAALRTSQRSTTSARPDNTARKWPRISSPLFGNTQRPKPLVLLIVTFRRPTPAKTCVMTTVRAAMALPFPDSETGKPPGHRIAQGRVDGPSAAGRRQRYRDPRQSAQSRSLAPPGVKQSGDRGRTTKGRRPVRACDRRRQAHGKIATGRRRHAR